MISSGGKKVTSSLLLASSPHWFLVAKGDSGEYSVVAPVDSPLYGSVVSFAPGGDLVTIRKKTPELRVDFQRKPPPPRIPLWPQSKPTPP